MARPLKLSFLSNKGDAYNWKFCRIGGVTRVKIESGEDIRHLPELDRKMWTVLNCPVQGLEMDAKTLQILDADHDGKIKVDEVIAASSYLTSVIKDADKLFEGSDTIALSEFNTENPAAAALLKSSQEVLSALGKEGEEKISIAEVADSSKIFAATIFNGDGVITAKSAGEDAEAAAVIADIIATQGAVADRSGEDGVNQSIIDAFFKACEDLTAWRQAGEADKAAIFPYGDKTADALAVCERLQDKLDDWFIRCKLAAFALDNGSSRLDVSQDAIAALGESNLKDKMDGIADYPLCKVSADAVLNLDLNGINPAWRDAVAAFKDLVFDGAALSEEKWKEIQASFAAYKAWMGAKAGASVEGLDAARVAALPGSGVKERLAALVAEDLRYEPEYTNMEKLADFLYLYRDFYTLLKNYVTFTDFYDVEKTAIFQAGRLYLDQRACDLCIKVSDMGNQEKMAYMSGCFLIFCNCTNKARSESFTIIAALTVGETGNVKVGKNGVFYDRAGVPWDATITKIIENPISIPEAFWSPYRKLSAFIDDKINKAAADKDSKVMGDMTSKVGEGLDKPIDKDAKPQPFDIAKYCGIFAAIGMAVGYIGSFLVAIATGFFKLTWWQMPLSILAVMLLISGPSMFLAWRKLRKRNLSPVLNANGWAMNANVKINIRFGETLTSQAKFPKVQLADPFESKGTPAWVKWVCGIVIALAVACAVLYFNGTFKKIFQKEAPATEVVSDCAVEAAPAATETPAE
ncbi:MAG: hypothetical protein IJU13_00370 [Bacteroidales bacterium]|nr:hypothetical protein [Bacteroidales bacterium]